VFQQNFAHLDFKVENLVFREPSSDSELVLVDFGAAQHFVQAPYARQSNAYKVGFVSSLGFLYYLCILRDHKYLLHVIYRGFIYGLLNAGISSHRPRLVELWYKE
jgi:hypothetical protein